MPFKVIEPFLLGQTHRVMLSKGLSKVQVYRRMYLSSAARSEEASERTCAEGPAASKPCQPTDTYLHDTNPKTKPVQRKAFGRREQARIYTIYLHKLFTQPSPKQ